MKTLLLLFVIGLICKETMSQQSVTLGAFLGVTTDEQRDCVWTCPKTPEYNPICGTDGVAYRNIGHLNCAQYCGIDVQPTHPPPCPPVTTTTTSTTPGWRPPRS
ncbi:uncharacterized protein LOC135075843 [Ostrinia nubilalis]|uniref:uncharacterized protein LOC135075843 n=1 Tax=Ostrinia nubilalis TaxID=29057 RepID=UPI00308229F4